MALTSEQWKSLEDMMAHQIGQETIANGLGSPQAQGTGSPSYSENASPRERYNQLWEIRKQQAAEAAESAEQREERRERVRSNFLNTMNQVQEKQNRTNEASATPAPGSVQAQNLEFLSQYQQENSLLARLKKTGQAAVSGIKGAVASNTDAQRALYEAGQSSREARMQEDLKDLEERLAEARRAYGQLREQVDLGNRDFTERDVQDKADQIKQLEVQISAYKKAPESQRGAAEETSKLADEVKKSAEADIERAKKGRGKLGSFFMDAVAGGAQLLGDIGAGAITGGGAMPSLALRSFGGGTQQARQAGASLGQQIGFGAATATVEMLTEKMADGLAGAFGKGAADDVAEEVIRRLASTPTGQTALRALYSMGGEGVEEVVSELVSPALKAIYDKGESAKESYGTKEGRKALAADALYSGLLGAALGAPGSAVNIATGRDAQANARNQELTDIYKEIGTPGINQAVKDRGILENIKGGKDYGNLSVGEQANEAMEALRGRTPESVRAGQLAGARNRLFEIQQQRAAEANAARQNATTPQTPQNAAQAQAAPTGEITPPTAPNAQGEAGAQPQAAETAQEASNKLAETNNSISSGIDELIDISDTIKHYGSGGKIDWTGLKKAQLPLVERLINLRCAALDYEYSLSEDEDIYDRAQSVADTDTSQSLQDDLNKQIDLIRWAARKVQDAKGNYDYYQAKGAYNDGKRRGNANKARAAYENARNYLERELETAARIKISLEIQSGTRQRPAKAANLKQQSETAQARLDGTVTEEELRAEWERMHPQEEAATATEPEAAPGPAQPAEAASAGSEQNAGTIPASAQTTAERTNGQGPQRERGMSENLRNNEKAEPDLRNSFEQNRDLYTQLTNAEVSEKASEIIGKGYEAARNEIYEKIGQAKAGAKLAPEYAVAGYQLANEMVRRGDTEAARELCADIAAELTYAGQVGQIGRLILAADPSIRIRTVNRLVQKLNDGLSNRQKAKNVKKGVGTESGEIKVSDEAMQRYAEAETDEAANDAMDAIEQEIADQIPATFRDKFTALRYLNMLGNLKTQARNIVGNTVMMAATNAKYLTQHVGELAAAAATGGEYQVNTALITSKELRRQAAADFAANIDEIKGDAKFSDVGRQAAKGVREKQQIFGAKTGNALWDNTGRRIGQGLEVARKATNAAMDIGDEIFLRQVYVRSFAGWMKAHGITDANNASAEQISAAREFAKKEAQEATFHDSNKVSDWVSSLGRGQNTPKVIKMISEGIVPFRKTPANVAVRAVEYSPAGIAGTIYTAVQAKKGNASAADVINSAAKNLTGTALFVAGMMLSAAGRARASGDDEDEKLTNFQKLQGAMDYSVKVGDTYISLSQLAPTAIPFFMGVKLNELMESNDNLLSLDSLGDLLGVVSEPMLEMSMLSGVNDILNDLSSLNGDTGGLPALIGNAALSYLSQGLTNTLLGQLEQMSERNRQTTYTDTKSVDATAFDRFLGKNQYKIGKYSAKIPGIDYNQQDYVDAWGRTQSNGGAGDRAFNALLNPTYTGKDRSTDVDAELERLYRDNQGKEGFPDVFPQKRGRSDTIGDGVVMTPDEYLTFSKESGQKKLELVREFMQSSGYKDLTDEQRAETIHNLYAFADATALQKVRDANGVKSVSDYTKLLQGVVKPGNGTDNDIPALKEKNAAEYIAFDTSYKGAVKAGDYSNIDNLLARYSKLDKNTQAVIAAKNPESINNLLKYSQAGVKSQSYFTIQDAIDDAQIELDKSGKTGGDVQMLGLASANIPESEKAKLIESGAFKLSKNRKAAYDVLTEYGYTVKDAYDFFEDADYSYSPKQSQYVADGTLSPLEVAAAIQRSGIPDDQKAAAFDAVRELLQGDGGKNDTWVNQRTGKPWTYQSEIDYIQKTGYTYGKGGSVRPKSSGNVLYDYYKERAKAQK